MKTTIHFYHTRLLLALVLMFMANAVWAMTTPTSGQLGYQFYDIFVNDTVQGPIGYSVASGLGLFGLVSMFRSWIMGVLGLVTGAGVGMAASLPASYGLIM